MNEIQMNQSKAAVLERGIDVLLAIKHTPIATTKVIQLQALPNLTKRSTQRYLKSLEALGLVYSICSGNNDDYRYFLTGKAKQLFGAQG